MNRAVECTDVTFAEELQSHVINLLDAFKYPRKMEFVETLPKTLTGKVMRNVLKSKEFKKC